jgi:C1A family cysteine protease
VESSAKGDQQAAQTGAKVHTEANSTPAQQNKDASLAKSSSEQTVPAFDDAVQVSTSNPPHAATQNALQDLDDTDFLLLGEETFNRLHAIYDKDHPDHHSKQKLAQSHPPTPSPELDQLISYVNSKDLGWKANTCLLSKTHPKHHCQDQKLQLV